MKKNLVKTISIFLLMLMITVIGVSTISQAASFDSVDVGFVANGAKDDSGASDSILSMVQSLVVVFQVVAVGIAVIMLIVLAIKYMTAAPGDKADIKKSATIYVVGAVILFSSSALLGIIKNFAKNISGTAVSG